ncbi:hypothetical protein AGMMS49960_18370 [Betaproteobacteria bacterium]|nr:hypothetical protein AGMMS49543_13280 [Betaproteobacteria bacterium]GHU03667.1 hypothetical protein AGMMS49960_18370 [Betaproteobacteria bacterium]GHU10282.1 hypothetical protein AGMMS50225_13350 [Betaproteobacteria bacterium]GHU20705.1 hypothetical protein AGMMS50243_16240 [Betaproteobacteria bacterium]
MAIKAATIMSGIIALFVLGLFVTVLHFVKKWLFGRYDDKLNSLPKRLVASVVFWVLAFTLPVADEIVGGFQFRALCREGAQLMAEGGLLMGSIGIPEYNTPLTFDFSSCSSPRYGELDKQYQFKRVN